MLKWDVYDVGQEGAHRGTKTACVRRLALIVSVCALLGAVPARAEIFSHTGAVSVSIVSPQAARIARVAGVPNGVVADVFALPASADGRTYTLKKTGGATGLENPDVYFYQGTDTAIGDGCTTDAYESDPATETGTVCPRTQDKAAWAIVLLRVGAQATYTLTLA